MTPTPEYKEGWQACCNDSKQCPYSKGSKESKRWWAGWFNCNSDPVRLSENSAYF